MSIYNEIGKSYSQSRLTDVRIVERILDLLDLQQGSIIADIGAGTGGYSRAIADRGFFVRALEPSEVMRNQAVEHPRVQWLTGYAEDIPLPDSSVDGAIAILAVHHFSNFQKAIREMNRITRSGSFVFLTFDPRVADKLWLADYFPIYRSFDFRVFSPLSEVIELIETNSQRKVNVSTFMLPHDLTDLFAAAGWRRPSIYLDPEVRAGISALALGDRGKVEEGVKKLSKDLESGKWDEKSGKIRELTSIDAGYRFLCARRRLG